MQYFDVTRAEFEQYAELCGDEWNAFVEEHYRATCTVCGKDYNYAKESPILKDEVWKRLIKKFKLSKFETQSRENHSRYYASKMKLVRQRIGDAMEGAFKKGIVWKKMNGRYIQNITDYEFDTPDDCHCTLCESCMEKGLGRKLQVGDIATDCTMGMNYAVAHFGKEEAEREKEKEEKTCN